MKLFDLILRGGLSSRVVRHPVTMADRFDVAVAIYMRHEFYVGDEDKVPSWAGVFIKKTRHFARGDVVVGWYMNGQGERQPGYGYSSVHHAPVANLECQYARYENFRLDPVTKQEIYAAGPKHDRVPMILIPFPDEEARDRKPLDPDTRAAMLAALQTAYSARTVGSG